MCRKKMLYSLKVKLKIKIQVLLVVCYVSFYILIESLFISISKKIVIITLIFLQNIFLYQHKK